MKVEDIKKLTKAIEKQNDKFHAETLKELNALSAENQEKALLELQRLYPESFEILFGKIKN